MTAPLYKYGVFGDEVDIHDHISVTIEWENGVRATYSEVAFGPYENRYFHMAGTAGRIEASLGERRFKQWDLLGNVATQVECKAGAGGHGGSDPALLAAMVEHFGNGGPAPVPVEEAREAVAIAAAANKSIETGLPVNCNDAP